MRYRKTWPWDSGLCAERGLVRALRRLVAVERLERVDVAERRVARRQLLRGRDAEPLRQHRRERTDLHVAETGELADPALQVGRVLGLRPDPLRVAAVLVRDESGEVVHAGGHRAGEAMDRRLLAEHL